MSLVYIGCWQKEKEVWGCAGVAVCGGRSHLGAYLIISADGACCPVYDVSHELRAIRSRGLITQP